MINQVSPDDQRKLVLLKEDIVTHFKGKDWADIGGLTGSSEVIQNHPRLLRSLSWDDEDYPEHVMSVLMVLVGRDLSNLKIIEDYLAEKFDVDPGANVSTAPSRNVKIVFTPSVF